MSTVEYIRLEVDKFIFDTMKEVADESPNAARALFVPLALYQAIECVVFPLFIVLEEFYLMAIERKGNWNNIITNGVKFIISPLVIISLVAIRLLSGLIDPVKEIHNQSDSISNKLKDLSLQNLYEKLNVKTD